jgi:hypothetical protein
MTINMPQGSAARPSRKRAQDFTGRQAEKLAEERRVQQQESAQRVAMVTAVANEELNEIVDYTGTGLPVRTAEVIEVEVNTPYRMVRTNQDIENLTWGREVLDPGDMTIDPPRAPVMGGLRTYNFKQGQQVKIDKDLADHLDSHGFLSFIAPTS